MREKPRALPPSWMTAHQSACTSGDVCAQDVKSDDEVVEVYTDFTELKAVEEALRAQGLNIVTAESTLVPKTMISVDGDKAQSNLKMIDRLEELDDVQQVYTNLELSDEQVAALS